MKPTALSDASVTTHSSGVSEVRYAEVGPRRASISPGVRNAWVARTDRSQMSTRPARSALVARRIGAPGPPWTSGSACGLTVIWLARSEVDIVQSRTRLPSVRFSTAGASTGDASGRWGRPSRNRQLLLGRVEAVVSDDAGVLAAALLDEATAGRVVDVDQPEAGPEALRPFEVVQQRPMKVAADVGAGLDRAVHGREVGAQEPDAAGVRHAPGGVGLVQEDGAVLGDEDGQRAGPRPEALEEVGEAGRRDLPAGVGVRDRRRWRHDGPRQPAVGDARRHDSPRVVVDAQEV